MSTKNKTFNEQDSELWQAIAQEQRRQEQHIELIASENYASPNVLRIQGSVLTNKYAEGYPGKRYYGGCKHIDTIENIAINRAKKLFSADYVNVQPHSGSQANAAVLMALLQPGDKILGMGLAAGGHLTHGAKVSFSGKIYTAIQYGVNEKTGNIDYGEVKALAQLHHPKLIIAGFSAYSGIVDWGKFRTIADECNANLLVDMAHVAGLVATGLYPNPVSIADVVTSTTHKTLAGPRGGLILAKANSEIASKLDSAIFPGLQGGPLCHVIAAKAAAFQEALQPEFKIYQKQVLMNAKTMANVCMERGFDIVSNGTDNHLFLINLTSKEITGKDADYALGKANITVNKNTVPNDCRSSSIASGIRVGTPAITRRGFKEQEAIQVTNWICDILDDLKNENKIAQVKQKALELCKRFPVYPADQ